jgi:hypothetical protein
MSRPAEAPTDERPTYIRGQVYITSLCKVDPAVITQRVRPHAKGSVRRRCCIKGLYATTVYAGARTWPQLPVTCDVFSRHMIRCSFHERT